MTLVPATLDILTRLHGKVPDRNTRAIAVVDGDAVLGAAGYYLTEDRAVVWAHIGDALKNHRRLIVEGGRWLFARLKNCGLPVYAIRDKAQPSADRFLRHWGFTPFTEDLYLWQA